MIMEDIKQRIRKYMSVKNYSGRKLADLLAMNPVVVNQYITKSKSNRSVSLVFVLNILELDHSLSAEWLLRGEGNMFRAEVKSNDYAQQLEAEIMVKDGIIQELRSIILEKRAAEEVQSVG